MFDDPSQPFQDWVSQRWVMATGRRYEPVAVPWLNGPFGESDVIADLYIERMADDEDLDIHRDVPGAGLIDSVAAFGLDASARCRLQTAVGTFYESTSNYDLDVWSQWNPVFLPGGRLIHLLYSRRLQQLDLPQRPLDTAQGINSDLLHLRDRRTGALKYAVWYRRLKATEQVVYSGVYTTCQLLDCRTCVKVVFPLPRGNATVLLSISVGQQGELQLESAGQRFGDPGLYLLLRDQRGRHWARYVRSFREQICVGDNDGLRADHLLTLWRQNVLHLHYRMRERLPKRRQESRRRAFDVHAPIHAMPNAAG